MFVKLTLVHIIMKNQRVLIVFLGLLYFIAGTNGTEYAVPSERNIRKGTNGVITIGEVLKIIRESFKINTSMTNTTERIPYHVSLAAQYGNLTSESVKAIDKRLKVMIAGTNRLMRKLQMSEDYQGREIPFDAYRGIMHQNVLIKELKGSTLRNSDFLAFKETNWFKFDGSPAKEKVYEVQTWFANLINDMDVLVDTEIEIIDFANIVAASGAAVTDFVSFFVADEYVERRIVDVGVLRYPDIEKPFFKLFRIKLFAYRRCFRILATQQDESGIKGDYETVSFIPRRKVMREMSKVIMDSAVREAEAMFGF